MRCNSQRLSMIRGGFSESNSGGYKQKLRMAAWTTAEGNSPCVGYCGVIRAKDTPDPGLFEPEHAPRKSNARRRYILTPATHPSQRPSRSLQQRGPEDGIAARRIQDHLDSGGSPKGNPVGDNVYQRVRTGAGVSLQG